MTQCWSEGALRAYIDYELPPEEIERVAAHLETCSHCGDLWAELAGRAKRVSALMSELDVAGPVVATPRLPLPRRVPWRWAAVAALAAGVIIGIMALPKRPAQVVELPPAPAADMQSAAGRAEAPLPGEAARVGRETAPLSPVVTLAAGHPAKIARRRSPKNVAADPQGNDAFLALDNEPIEAGVVLRVELGPREVPADVIIDADGRPRAIRLVNLKSNH